MKKYLILGLLVSVLVVGGVISIGALPAESLSISSGPGSPSSGGVSPMILNIGPNGNILMRGVVESSDASSLTIKSWGGSWEVRVSAATQIISLNRLLSDMQAGDFVGVLGTVLSDGSFVVDARIVREWGKKVDRDNDGISDDQDGDDDNDGLADASDLKPHDHDNDGSDDDLDNDDDDDGVEDNQDTKRNDHDDDGIRDSQDRDDDNDDIPDASDLKPHDRDNDGSDDDEDEDDDSDDSNSGSGSGGGN